MKIICVVGARPNFIKIASLVKEIKRHKEIDCVLVHTGQHYDNLMSDVFFRDLQIPKPDIFLGVRSCGQIEQIAEIMTAFEGVCLEEKPDMVLVVGDVNSTLAAALAANRNGIKVVHVEAGLRSFDRQMPEEINRIIVDQIADYLFITEESAYRNLIKEGINKNKIFFVGNVMIDALKQFFKKETGIVKKMGLKPKDYCLITMHRPSNVDSKERLIEIFDILDSLNEKIVWPIHPRTKKNIEKFNLSDRLKKYTTLEPLGYLDFMSLLKRCKLTLTDSGGIQEEATFLGVPCLTMRENTERPITITKGTNYLVGSKKEIIKAIYAIGKRKKSIPKYWDGKASKRIIDILKKNEN